ncbi:hypothetical protein P7C70_g8145, partial [Phenoliferia sp. Uapishka_3]
MVFSPSGPSSSPQRKVLNRKPRPSDGESDWDAHLPVESNSMYGQRDEPPNSSVSRTLTKTRPTSGFSNNSPSSSYQSHSQSRSMSQSQSMSSSPGMVQGPGGGQMRSGPMYASSSSGGGPQAQYSPDQRQLPPQPQPNRDYSPPPGRNQQPLPSAAAAGGIPRASSRPPSSGHNTPPLHNQNAMGMGSRREEGHQLNSSQSSRQSSPYRQDGQTPPRDYQQQGSLNSHSAHQQTHTQQQPSYSSNSLSQSQSRNGGGQPTTQQPPQASAGRTIAGEPLHDMGRAISLLKSQKFYAEGFLMKRVDAGPDGKAVRPSLPPSLPPLA